MPRVNRSPKWPPPETWDRGFAESMAAHYASTHPDVLEQVAEDEALKDALKRWLEVNGEDQLVDGETGLGVTQAPGRKNTVWVVRDISDEAVLSLKARGLLTILTPAFDALVKGTAGHDLDEAKKHRIDGQTAPSLGVVQR